MTEKQLRDLLPVWQRRLGLADWRIVLRVGGVEESTAYMEAQRSTSYERGVIYVQPWMVGDGDPPTEVMFHGDDLTDDFVESSLVHELLHFHTRDMRAVVREDLDGQVHRDVHTVLEAAMARAEEQCVDRLAEALVKAFHEKGGG